MGFEAPGTAISTTCRALPQSWDAELVGEKIVQAFVTLDLLPKVRTPRGPGSNWPKTMVEWTDQLAQAELTESERLERQQDANRVKIYPSALEISQMEMAFDWIREIPCDGSTATMVIFWALRTSQGRSIKRLCIEKQWARTTFWRKRAKALESLARMLNARAVPVF